MTRPTPYVASLRIYEPITAFSPAEQLRWESIPFDVSTGIEEQRRALHRTIVAEPTTVRPDGAHILEHEGKRYVCPWSTATRSLTALEDFKETLPAPVAKFFLPQNIEEAITSNSQLVEDKIPYIITETWMIPPRWFSLFLPGDRVIGEIDGEPFVFMRTSIAQAKQRCIFTHQTVVANFGNGPIEEEIADLLEWMSLFDADSIVEVDYGGLATYLQSILIANGEAGLAADTSIEDITTSLAGLASGDGEAAGRGYERLISRWRLVAAMESAS